MTSGMTMSDVEERNKQLKEAHFKLIELWKNGVSLKQWKEIMSRGFYRFRLPFTEQLRQNKEDIKKLKAMLETADDKEEILRILEHYKQARKTMINDERERRKYPLEED